MLCGHSRFLSSSFRELRRALCVDVACSLRRPERPQEASVSVGWCWPRGMASEVSARALGQGLTDPIYTDVEMSLRLDCEFRDV